MSVLRPLSRLPRAIPVLRSFYSSIPGEVPPTPGRRSPADPLPATSNANALPPTVDIPAMSKDVLTETYEQAQAIVSKQAPNRETTWSRSQQPRSKAMVGPRFEQTVFETQPRPYAAIELIHKVPVNWTDKRVVACDGGGGALGHPKVFINVDKPEIIPCEYCGQPFAHTHHKATLQAREKTDYPLA